MIHHLLIAARNPQHLYAPIAERPRRGVAIDARNRSRNAEKNELPAARRRSGIT
jgi:hypothetical protein